MCRFRDYQVVFSSSFKVDGRNNSLNLRWCFTSLCSWVYRWLTSASSRSISPSMIARTWCFPVSPVVLVWLIRFIRLFAFPYFPENYCQFRDRNFLFVGHKYGKRPLCVNNHVDTGCCVVSLAGIHRQRGLGQKNWNTPFKHFNHHQFWCFFWNWDANPVVAQGVSFRHYWSQ